MPRLRIIESLEFMDPDPLTSLHELMEGHNYSRICKSTYLKAEEDGALVMVYEDTRLITFKREGMVLDFGGWQSSSAISRVNAVLAFYGCFIERRKGGHDEAGLYIAEAGGRAYRLPDGPSFIPYIVEDREIPDGADGEGEQEAVPSYG